MRRSIRLWFKFPERLVIFTFGLLFSKGVMTYLLGNLMTFLTDFWNLKINEAAAIVCLGDGLIQMLQITVAFLIDAWLGYRRTLMISSLLYFCGLLLLGFSIPEYFFKGEKVCPLDKFHRFEKLKETPFWEGLTLVILGAAAQFIPLSLLSLEQTRVLRVPKDYEPTRVGVACCGYFWRFEVRIGGWRLLEQMILRCFCKGFIVLGTLVSTYCFITYKNSWDLRFLISAISLGLGFLWFICGLPLYGPSKLQPSPLFIMLRTFVASLHKRHLIYRGEGLEELYYGEGENLTLTSHLKWLNKAAIKELADRGKRWRLCTMKEVKNWGANQSVSFTLWLNVFSESILEIVSKRFHDESD